MKTSTFENFPWWMVAACNSVALAIYAIGLYLMAGLGAVWAVFYAAYCVWMEWRLLSGSCRSCSYFGKRCGFGKGVVCSWFFSKGADRPLCAKQISWRNVIPDFMVSLIPLGAGITLLIRSYSWLVLVLVGALVLLGSVGSGVVRGRLACR
ncbi:MAG: hypothetical protein KJ072_11485 [Verrucomicrobia bacterium]|nr:hypothetical protein [Verrucomicrobiota bacterium]